MRPFFLPAAPLKRRPAFLGGLALTLLLAAEGAMLSGCVPFWQRRPAPQPEPAQPSVVYLEQGEQVVTQPPHAASPAGKSSGLSTEALSR